MIGSEKYFRKMQKAGVTPDVVTYNALISTCARARKPERAEYWMKAMSDDNIEADAVSFCTIIDAWTRGGDVFRGLSWFERMEELGLQASVNCYGILMHA